MSWIQKLYDTYPSCVKVATDLGVSPPWPLAHFVKNAHIEVVIDDAGNFKRGRVKKLEREQSPTLIPATESSAGRTAGIAPHPLCEELSYCAFDLPGREGEAIVAYLTKLKGVCETHSADVVDKQTARKLAALHAQVEQLLTWCSPAALANHAIAEDDSDSDKAPTVGHLEPLIAAVNEQLSSSSTCAAIPHYLSEAAVKLVRKSASYVRLLSDWCASDFAHPKAKAVLTYLNKNCLWADLTAEGLFPVVVSGRSGPKTKVEDDKVFVRWRIETLGDPCSGTWEDESLIDAWANFDASQNRRVGFDMVTGLQARIAQNHSKFIRYPGDGGKLISANDFNGFTFKGRFTDSKIDYQKQVCSVSYEVSQKAHSALRWLVDRGYRNDDQAVVCWAVAGKPIPDFFANTSELFGILAGAQTESAAAATATDVGQAFAQRLKKAIAGYRAKLDPTDDIVVMGLDSATPGRMAITFYRELLGSEFLDRIEEWHSKCAWLQNLGKKGEFTGSPSPREIAEAAYGRWDEKAKKERVEEALLKTTVERLLPCIADGHAIPHDLVVSACRRATNRVALKRNEDGYEQQWEKLLWVACALFKGYHVERNYQMTLETDRMTRDYLYGRLLAIADSIEGYALSLTEEGRKRETTAARLMQRFADRPFSTWRNIELALGPYVLRLKAGSEKSAAFLAKRKRLLDEIVATLDSADGRLSDAALSGEFLLGYHCQRRAFRPVTDAAGSESETDDHDLTETTNAN